MNKHLPEENFFEQLPVGFYRSTPDGRILYANPALAALLDFGSVDELMDMSVEDLFAVKQDRKRQFEQLKSSGVIAGSEIKLKTVAGRYIWVRDTGRATFDENGEIVFIDGVIENITESKLAEEKIKQMNSELEERVAERTSRLEYALSELNEAKETLQNALDKEKELSNLKTRFISMISHEYRTPLTVILTSTYLIEQLAAGVEAEQLGRHLQKIRFSVKGMTNLLENVLTIGRSETSKLDYFPSFVDLINLTEEIVEEMKIIDKGRHKIVFSSEPEFCIINTDDKLLRQVLTNLMSNALKYSPSGTDISITLREKENNISIEIKDNGIGISQNDVENIFEPFHRGENIGATTGTGLGLAIVKRCVDTIGGKIDISTKLNEGTTFTINLPK